MSLEERLRLARAHSGMSQVTISKALGITDRTLKRYEKDASNLSIALAQKFSEITGVSKVWLAYGMGDMFCKVEDIETEKGKICPEAGPPISKERTRSTGGGLSVVVQEHIDLIPRFMDKETAKAANEKLIDLERLSIKNYKKIINQIETVWETVVDTIEDYESNLGNPEGGVVGKERRNGTNGH